MMMPGRKYSAGTGYRYGFNGKENDNDVAGDGNQYDYGFRIYNPRIGRFLSVDPLEKKYAELTTYQFASNTPLQATDLDGMEADFSAGKVLKRAEYKQYGGWLDNVVGNILIENRVGNNLSVAVQNQLVDGAEGVVNLFSTKGREKLLDGMAPTVQGLLAFESAGPAERIGMLKSYFSNAENLENLAASLFLSFAGRYLPSLKTIRAKPVITKAPYMSGRFIIGNRTLNRVTEHLNNIGVADDAGNMIMLERMQNIVNKKIKATDIDINFAKHELRESELMKKGMNQRDAHHATLKEQEMYHRDYEKKLYTKEALEASNEQWEKEIKKK